MVMGSISIDKDLGVAKPYLWLRILLIPLCLLIFTDTATSSYHYKELSVTRLSNIDLLNENIWSITQDHSGFLWLATTGGLKRYDGHRVLTFTSQIRNQSSLPNMNIRAVHVASTGDVWVATQGGGISLFDPMSRSFEHFKPLGDESVLAESIIYDFYSITEDSQGRLWLTNFPEHTVYSFDTSQRTFTSYPLQNLSDRSFIQPQALSIINDQVWIGTDGSGIIVMNFQGELLGYHTADPQLNSGLLSNQVQTIFVDALNRIWVGTLGGGLHWFDENSGRFISLNTSHDGLSMDYIYAIRQDEQGNLWVATNSGLFVIDPENHTVLTHFQHDPGNISSLTNDLIRSVFFDDGGIIWVGNQSGGVHQLKRDKLFLNITLDNEDSSGPVVQNVRSFFQYSDNSMLIGAGNGDIYVFNLHTRQVTQSFLVGGDDNNSLSAHEATSFISGEAGSIWFGTWGNGLRYFQPGEGLLRTYRFSRGNPESIPDNRVQLLHRSTDGTIWVGTESGLVIYDEQKGTFNRVMHQPIGWPPLGFAATQTLAFSEDDNSVYWVGTWQGLFRYDHANGHAIRYNYDFNDTNTLSSNHVTSLYDDRKGSLWIGTFGGGLNRLDKSTGKFELFTVEQGLSNNAVFGILPDNSGNLWISSSGGLSRLNPGQKTFMNFNHDDGLANKFFWWGSAYKANNGYLFFGHTSGFTMFHPDSISQSRRIPPVVLTSVKVFDQEIPFDINTRLELNYQQNYLTFEFAVIDFFNPGRNQYAYKLDGVNPDWVFAGSQNAVSFANLRGGDYTLRVRGANSDGVWSETGVIFQIYIKPPFWQTIWFYLLVVGFGIGAVIMYIQLRTKVIQARNALLEQEVSRRTSDLELKQKELLGSYVELRDQTELLRQANYELEQQKEMVQSKSQELQNKNQDLETLNQEKNNLIGIVAHDLRSPLSAVVSGLQLISMQPDMPREQLEQTISTMDGFIRKQLDMITRILDVESLESGNLNINPGQIDVIDIVIDVVENAAVAASGKNIAVKMDLPEIPVLVNADHKYLAQALENLVSNALKFSPMGSVVWVRVAVEEGQAVIRVQDEGPGISVEDHKKLFGRFQKLSARPTGGEKSIGLGLSIVKRFVEAMGGRVWCESEPGNGATFIIEFDVVERAM
jgi:signal transduction histidine kinase/ligand-binding sensor domain-containing protein